VIVDPVIAYVAGKDTHKANEVRSLLAPLAALAEKHKTAILAIRARGQTFTTRLFCPRGPLMGVVTRETDTVRCVR
jgi:hypothetical protein